ncbi:VacJ family lipoprotein [Iodobacter sp.]|uniref:MlaA family lipoprotein n=1 Tax=Iodobacter sp. TaxID=1915058 RepID=UPI0025EDDB22|nr:VacJ family lipoprotein [Iodobacter sp.]
MRRLLPLFALLLGACATPQNNYDPIEPVNRGIFAFNNAVDKAVLKPAAEAHEKYSPGPIKQGASNFFANIDDFFASFGALLQGKGTEAGHSLGRVAINSTLGMFGLVDWASDMGLKKSDEDIGQALGSWGMGSGLYLMIPLRGPTTLRDSSDLAVRLFADPLDIWNGTQDFGTQIARYGAWGVEQRRQLLPLDPMIDAQADPYAFLRDSYLQRRYYRVWDGAPPQPLQLGPTDAELDAMDAAKAPNASTPASAAVGVAP